jgi:hypothetical protein
MDQQPRLPRPCPTQEPNFHSSLLQHRRSRLSRRKPRQHRQVARHLALAGLFAAVRGMASALGTTATSLIIWWVIHR